MIKSAAACLALFFSAGLAACGGVSDKPQQTEVADPKDPATKPAAQTIEQLAEQFVKLVLAVGEHDAAFVDAYHGPPEWAEAAKAAQRPLDELEADARLIIGALDGVDQDARTALLQKQLVATLTRVRMARGETFSFDEETRLLYDAVAREYNVAEFDAVLAEIENLVPGEGPLNERVDAFRNSLAIPVDKLQVVFDAAIAECRKRTLARYDLPEGEKFSLEFVTDKPWSGYNWYQGEFESLIQVNTDLPIVIDRAVDLGCHEGYPGHHTWNVLLERDLLRANEWIEYSVYPLFSPMSVIAEGSANYGIVLAFPGDEKIAFERDVLFPIAGLDPANAARLDELNKLTRKLSHSGNMIAREYLDGEIDRAATVALLMKYQLYSQERAEQRASFIETYRGYVINYNLGRDLVREAIAAKAAGGADPWDAFSDILTTPTSASDLIAAIDAQ